MVVLFPGKFNAQYFFLRRRSDAVWIVKIVKNPNSPNSIFNFIVVR